MEAGGEAAGDDTGAEQGLGEVIEGEGEVQAEAEGPPGAVSVCAGAANREPAGRRDEYTRPKRVARSASRAR